MFILAGSLVSLSGLSLGSEVPYPAKQERDCEKWSDIYFILGSKHRRRYIARGRVALVLVRYSLSEWLSCAVDAIVATLGARRLTMPCPQKPSLVPHVRCSILDR